MEDGEGVREGNLERTSSELSLDAQRDQPWKDLGEEQSRPKKQPVQRSDDKERIWHVQGWGTQVIESKGKSSLR